MSIRRYILLVGAAALFAGLIGLLVPVSVTGSDEGTIGCGNAMVSDLSDARSANDQNLANVPVVNQLVPHTDYVAECQSSLAGRRAWSIPLTVVGGLTVLGAAVVRRRPAAV
ncbi:aminopeptidase [Mycobacterium talmoniae]|uniref:Aminopeptidase n=1 Tax=Mycobacterium talmoniae TaxID=1858794 RepID=A0A1S1NA29_9MYCO|nr:aminopeptidase [Mycobacterium talmoniae]OHU95135.1 aminopeptidase [Mycobacterium talmoniae]PQM45721.1 hypothetical protein C1Y40_04108 [Mycobacterium talmoniae]